MMLSRTQILLIVASMVTLGLTWQTYQEDQSAGTVLPTRVLATPENKAQAALAVSAAQDDTLVLLDRALVPLTGDLFAKPYVKPKPKPVFKRVVRRAAPKPVIAPLPFKYIGRWQDKDKQAVMLDYRGEMLVAKQGDIVAGRYKLEAISESAGRMQLTFLEMTSNKRQTMRARVGQP